MLDRNGLRPGRWMITRDGWVCLGSESGIFTVEPDKIARMGRLRAGAALHRRPRDRARQHRRRGRDGRRRGRPLRRVVRRGQARRPRAARSARDDPADRAAAEAPARLRLHAGGHPDPARAAAPRRPRADRLDGQRPLARRLQRPRAVALQLLQAALRAGHEPRDRLGPRADRDEPAHRHRPAGEPAQPTSRRSSTTSSSPIRSSPTSSSSGCAATRTRRSTATTIDTTWPLDNGEDGLEPALDRIREQAIEALEEDTTLLVLSDRATGPERVPIPSLLACSTVHHALVREGTRLRAALVVESGEPREIHHLACLIGYGATAINPYLMLETMTMMDEPTVGLDGPIDGRVRSGDRRDQEGPAEDPLEDRDRDHPLLPRRADLRDRRPRRAGGRRALRRHPLPARRHRRRRARRARRSTATPTPTRARTAWRCAELRRGGGAARRPPEAAAAGRRLPLAPRRREAHVGPGDDRLAAARGPLRGRRRAGVLRRVQPPGQRGERAARAAARAARPARERHPLRPARGRGGEGDRQALLDRRDEPRRALAGGARDARDRDEPHRRLVQQRRGRRGPAPQHARRRTATSAARASARSPPAASASTSTTSRGRIRSRSRSPRAPSPARAGSCPATRSTTTSARCASRCRGSS